MSGIKLTPAIQNVVLNPGLQEQVVEVQFENKDSQSRLVSFSLRDFATTGRDGQIQFLQPGEGAFRLTPFARIEGPEQRIVDSGEMVTLKVVISPSASLAPTGYYGALVAQVSDPLAGGTLGVQPAISSLLLVRLAGRGDEQVALKSIETNDSLFRLPTEARLAIQNPGEVHTAPRGRVLLLSPRQTIVAKGTLNQDSSYLLPGVQRSYGTPLSTIESEPWYQQIGIYELITEYRADGASRPSVSREDVMYINPYLVLSTIAVVATLFMLLRWTAMRFRLGERVSKILQKSE